MPEFVTPGWIRRLLREPVVHFMVLGAAMFVGYGYLRPAADAKSPYEIALTLDELAQLEMLFEGQWHRPPTPAEFADMVEVKMQQEVLYREALALGLDQDDEIVKRRMAQKMRFLAEDVAAAHEPTSEELSDWYAQNSDKFALSGRVGFRHLYFSPDRRGKQAYDDALRALASLTGEPADSKRADAMGDRFMYQDYYADRTSVSLAKDFGPQFAVEVMQLTPGSWQGPIESGFGWHLVYVDSLVPGRVPAFEEVERDVKTAWLAAQKEAAWQQAYQEIRAKYTLLIPVPPDDSTNLAGDAVSSNTETRPEDRAAPH